MKDKIEEYIKDNITKGIYDNEELHNELVSNSFDRYDEYIQDGIEPYDAYIKTISLLGDFDEKQEDEKQVTNNFKMFVSVLIGLIVVNTITFITYSKTYSDIVIMGTVIVSLFLVFSYYYLIDKQDSENQAHWLKQGSIINLIIGVFLSLHVFQMFSPFLASGTYYNHLAEYVLVGVLGGYLISFIGFRLVVDFNTVYQNLVKIPLEIILLTIGTALFTKVNYYESLLSQNYSLITVTSSFLILIMIMISLTYLVKAKNKYRMIYVITLLAALVTLGELQYIFILKPTSSTYRSFTELSYQLGRIIIVFTLFLYGYKIIKQNIEKYQLISLITLSLSNILLLRMLSRIPSNIRVIINNNPGLIASIPFDMKQSITGTYIVVIILFSLYYLIHYVIEQLRVLVY
jgi:hypothetical protein